MRRNASEIVRELEMRIARLEQTKIAGSMLLEIYFYEGKVGIAVDSNTTDSDKLKSLEFMAVKEQSLGYEIIYFKEPRLTKQAVETLRIWGGGGTRAKLTPKNSSTNQRESILQMYLNPKLYSDIKGIFDLTTTEISIY
jgi:hypothetical protein